MARAPAARLPGPRSTTLWDAALRRLANLHDDPPPECAFPVGDDPPSAALAGLQAFCCEPAHPGSPYCPEHHLICMPGSRLIEPSREREAA